MHVPLSEDLVMSSQYRFISNSEPIKGIYMYVNCTDVKENVGQVIKEFSNILLANASNPFFYPRTSVYNRSIKCLCQML